ncbi:hypothetical protein KAZ82_02220 [Candidatus Babeliales bacterium]|nr:hypothetical protein [Candidatus Babeliales bacterium]
MKIFKYLILAVLIVSLTKKIHVANNAIYDSGSVLYDQKAHLAFKTTDENQMQMFAGVIAVNPTVTPPNVSAPALEFIATIEPAPSKSPVKHRYGRSNKQNLFGILLQGDSTPVFDSTDDSMIGLYWNQKKLVTIPKKAIFVAIIEQKQISNHGFYALGPIWTWFDTPTLRKELKKYGISIKQVNFKNLVQPVGYILKNDQKYMLYGVQFDANQEKEKPAIMTQIIAEEQRPIERETQIPSMDSMTKKLKANILSYSV